MLFKTLIFLFYILNLYETHLKDRMTRHDSLSKLTTSTWTFRLGISAQARGSHSLPDSFDSTSSRYEGPAAASQATTWDLMSDNVIEQKLHKCHKWKGENAGYTRFPARHYRKRKHLGQESLFHKLKCPTECTAW